MLLGVKTMHYSSPPENILLDPWLVVSPSTFVWDDSKVHGIFNSITSTYIL